MDYNFKAPADTRDAVGPEAAWTNRKPDQPFLDIFN